MQSIFDLNTKGNGWIAAFPTPNRSIRLSLNGSDPLIGEDDVLTEDFEDSVDKTPSNYDFLGKGIDGGFRISRNSSIETLTISPALAYLLCRAKRNIDTTGFDCRFVFHEPQEFKGVVKGQRYPVVSIITSRDDSFDRLQNLEACLLDRPREADFVTLFEYLETYIAHHKIEKPELKLTAKSANVSPPEHYAKYIEEWKKDLEAINFAKTLEESAASAVETSEDPTKAEEIKIKFDFEDILKHFSNVGASKSKPLASEDNEADFEDSNQDDSE